MKHVHMGHVPRGNSDLIWTGKQPGLPLSNEVIYCLYPGLVLSLYDVCACVLVSVCVCAQKRTHTTFLLAHGGVDQEEPYQDFP